MQKHLASHLHYDFRLEHDGVLLSWAVPKGPSLDPATKRLAMHVEDHPIDYGEFEGVIPSGYGAGIVMLWDNGTWTPEVDDVDAALKKGDLKFTLDGYKLKGSWVLVRTSGGRWGGGKPGDARSWLLIKHRDEWAGDVDITEFAPLSVKSRATSPTSCRRATPRSGIRTGPPQGGEAGAMFEKIVERALEMRRGDAASSTDRETTDRPPAADEEDRGKGAASAKAAGREEDAGRRKARRRHGRRPPARTHEGGHEEPDLLNAPETAERSWTAAEPPSAAFADQHRPDGERQPAPVVARDLGAPEHARAPLRRRRRARPASSGSLCSAA